MKLKRYKVHITSRHSWLVRAFNTTNAKKQVWAQIRGGYTYGYTSESDFIKRARVTRVAIK